MLVSAPAGKGADASEVEEAGVFRWMDRWRAPQLYEKARALIARADYEQALKLAARLGRVGFGGGFVIEAMVHRANNRLVEAALALEAGIRKAPGEWLLHNMLGQTYAGLDRFDEALIAFQGAAEGGGDADFVGYNVALVWHRQQRYEEALKALPARPANPEFRDEIIELRLRMLYQLQRYFQLVEELEAEEEVSSPSHWLGAQAWLALGRFEQAQQRALLALKTDFSAGPEVQALLEHVADPATLTCRRYVIRFQGMFKKRPRGLTRATGGISLAQVVAENPSEALALYKAAEMPEIIRDFTLQRCEDRGPCPADQKGSFGSPRRIFY